MERIAPGGRALLRTPEGVVFARGGLPGERVRVRIERAARGVRHGVVVDVLEPSSERVTPDCGLHPCCGGCDLLDLAASGRARVKVELVRDALTRVGKVPGPTLEQALQPLRAPGAGDDGARRRASLVMHQGAPTFSVADGHERVAVERCPALHPTLQGALATLARSGLPQGLRVQLACDDRPGAVIAVVDDDEAARGFVAAGGRGAVVTTREAAYGDASLVGEVTAGSFPCRSDAGVFAQATRFGGRAILEEVMRAATPAPGVKVLELFAGSGHLTVPLAAAGCRVEAVEGDARATRFCADNLTHTGVAERAAVRTAYIDEHLALAQAPDVVVADPPRTGIPGLAALARRLDAPRWVLVACDVATGARDVAILRAQGFALASLVPIDAFPRTSHVEWVALLQR